MLTMMDRGSKSASQSSHGLYPESSFVIAHCRSIRMGSPRDLRPLRLDPLQAGVATGLRKPQEVLEGVAPDRRGLLPKQAKKLACALILQRLFLEVIRKPMLAAEDNARRFLDR